MRHLTTNKPPKRHYTTLTDKLIVLETILSIVQVPLFVMEHYFVGKKQFLCRYNATAVYVELAMSIVRIAHGLVQSGILLGLLLLVFQCNYWYINESSDNSGCCWIQTPYRVLYIIWGQLWNIFAFCSMRNYTWAYIYNLQLCLDPLYIILNERWKECGE